MSISKSSITNDRISTLLSAIFFRFGREPTIIAYILLTFSDSLFPCNYSFSRSRSLLSVSFKSLMFFGECEIHSYIIHYSYIITLHLRTDIGRSLIYIGKRSGPRRTRWNSTINLLHTWGCAINLTKLTSVLQIGLGTYVPNVQF